MAGTVGNNDRRPLPPMRASAGLGWLSIVRLGLVQASLGSIVVLTTSVLEPRHGGGTDACRRDPRPAGRTCITVCRFRDRSGGMDPTAAGGARPGSLAVSCCWRCRARRPPPPRLLFGSSISGWRWRWRLLSFICIGLGIGAAGTSLLALLASRTALHRKPAAATIVWMMMIGGNRRSPPSFLGRLA
jgi:BCD family chlorophyll transporter-like MFS transporter